MRNERIKIKVIIGSIYYEIFHNRQLKHLTHLIVISNEKVFDNKLDRYDWIYVVSLIINKILISM